MVPLRVGIVGTGYAAKTRAEILLADTRSHLVAITGRTSERTIELSQALGIEALPSWLELVNREDIDLVFICTVNRDHGAIARAALQTGKHVVVEYPLSLNLAEAEDLITLAKIKDRLLHIEHIEILSGIHVALQESLAEIGEPFYVRSSNLAPQHPAPQKWTYDAEQFGFPLIGALARIHRLTNLFGQVKTVSCQLRYTPNLQFPTFYQSCLCTAQLNFISGLVADVIYAKGDALWQTERTFVIHGSIGALLLEGEEGVLVRKDSTTPLAIGSRRGLFAKDTAMILDHLIADKPLYVTPASSLYALQVADAARQSTETGQTIVL
jgi:biliverdin reductase